MNAAVSINAERDVSGPHSESAHLHRPERGRVYPANRESAIRRRIISGLTAGALKS